LPSEAGLSGFPGLAGVARKPEKPSLLARASKSPSLLFLKLAPYGGSASGGWENKRPVRGTREGGSNLIYASQPGSAGLKIYLLANLLRTREGGSAGKALASLINQPTLLAQASK